MTDDQINIAIAEACGFIPIVEAEYPNRNIWSKLGITYCACDLPNYCHDLNAMHEAEAMITVGEIGRHLSALSQVVQPLSTYHPMDMQWWTVRATARQRAEAFLRVKGLWKEKV